MKNFALQLLTLSLLVLFFIIFSFWPATSPTDLPLKIVLEVAPAQIALVPDGQPPTLQIKYRLANTSGKTLDETRFFGRITLNRAYAESNGFILKEWSQKLAPGQEISGEFLTKLDFLPAIYINYQVYFNWYQKGPKGLDKIVASAARRIDVNASVPNQ